MWCKISPRNIFKMACLYNSFFKHLSYESPVNSLVYIRIQSIFCRQARVYNTFSYNKSVSAQRTHVKFCSLCIITGIIYINHSRACLPIFYKLFPCLNQGVSRVEFYTRDSRRNSIRLLTFIHHISLCIYIY